MAILFGDVVSHQPVQLFDCLIALGRTFKPFCDAISFGYARTKCFWAA